jgi:hypothetical protein
LLSQFLRQRLQSVPRGLLVLLVLRVLPGFRDLPGRKAIKVTPAQQEMRVQLVPLVLPVLMVPPVPLALLALLVLPGRPGRPGRPVQTVQTGPPEKPPLEVVC